ncbi:RnfABCDGE type electron transport complex subunit B [Brenneria goodwinii]|uniref:Ion-translocating oxidoreductase complex subunit B n=1 Tax=Brenneria goodwinii TaxID=1109412 RepID=A0A0G4K121_9GAMM|nr:RnfABCDGE type electron transport complex subunit B [Brenneria goodwinii]MCG8156653.1 RnfABCDGE type electron transport complex subunit B [Brenneria goodwinii]MCG8159721.1 RnfABCDGE type electron transport complex subunit B [Brenneria goodwinii]MCG8165811.1 RnfABCDGE type electron transport complex subunit B [Brenneria goodwinii]MCG8170228.1 RnfABCDGE type electron transport complex subunit B [Brenneria goodwinii]MCG8173580.1 RnfABCDGE type electron transport complex subunit B [Brenneria go
MLILTLLAIPLISAMIGALLGYASIYLKVESDPMIDSIAALLPSGQCGQCGYPGCRQAAIAIAGGEAAVTICSPGGNMVAQRIADLMGINLDDSGTQGPMVAVIVPQRCDGCGRCSKQCAFDAIVGATRQLHGVLSEDCTGCGSCVSACPNNCIQLYADPHLTPAVAKPGLPLRQEPDYA